jgi:hypothetical protein
MVGSGDQGMLGGFMSDVRRLRVRGLTMGARPSCDHCQVTMWDPAREPIEHFSALYSLTRGQAKLLRMTLAADGSNDQVCMHCNRRLGGDRSFVAALLARLAGQPDSVYAG